MIKYILPLVPLELEGSMAEFLPPELHPCLPLKWLCYSNLRLSGHTAFSAHCVKHPSASLLCGHLWSHLRPVWIISPSQKPKCNRMCKIFARKIAFRACRD